MLLLLYLSSVLLNGFVDRGLFDPVMAKEILQKTTQIKFAKWKEFVIFVIKWSNILMEKCQKLHLEKKQLNCDSPVYRSIFIQVKILFFFKSTWFIIPPVTFMYAGQFCNIAKVWLGLCLR